MRPDEEANRDEIQRDQRFRSNVAKGIGTAATIGAGAATTRILPFLSKFIPTDLAMKGLSKVSPKLADFLKRGQSMGLNVDEGIQYIRDSIQPKQQEGAKQNKNIVEQYSPELHQFMTESIGSGEDPIRVAATAILDKKKNFESIIRKMEKDHNTPWTSIVESVYGGQGGKNTPDPKEAARINALKKFKERKKGLVETETERFEQAYGNPQQQGQGGNKWDTIAKGIQDILNS